MEQKTKFQQIVVPLVTPLTEQFALDEAAVERIIAFMHEHSCSPFILGTTGEAASLPLKLKKAYLKKAASLKNERLPLYVGVGSNCLDDAIELANHSFEAGADVVVATLPSYYALTESQVMKYFEQLANAIEGPLMIYNIPATTHISIPLQLIDQLSRHEKIVGVKDSERNDDRLNQSLELWTKRADFSFFLGWAARAAHALQKGAAGIVPSTGNINPELYNDMRAAIAGGHAEDAHLMQLSSDEIGNIYQAGRTLGDSLAALKALMNRRGLCEPYMMPPLEKLPAETQQQLKEAYAAIVS